MFDAKLICRYANEVAELAAMSRIKAGQAESAGLDEDAAMLRGQASRLDEAADLIAAAYRMTPEALS